jgi:hypothetical protein
MTDEHRISQLLRKALPPSSDQRPSRDLWPLVAQRVQTPSKWSRIDIGLGLLVGAVLVLFPQWLIVIAYHL